MWERFPSLPTEPLPASPFERGLCLRNGLIAAATDGTMSGDDYKNLRREFMEDPTTADLLPSFVRSCLDVGDFWSFIKNEFRHYEERRVFLREQFQPLVMFLERKDTPAADLISDTLLKFDEGGVHRAWRKGSGRL